MGFSFPPVTLKDVLKKNGYIRGPFGSALKRADMKETGISVYEQQHAISNTRTFRYFIDNEKYETLKRFTVQENDLIISCSGTVGKISIINKNDPVGIISQALLILRPEYSKVSHDYLYYFLSSKKGHHSLIQASHGSVQVNIAPRNVVEQITFNLPKPEEQKKIVSILKTLDEKITLNAAMNQTLEDLAQTIFKSWFVDFEPFKEGEFIESELGMIPAGWSISSFSDTINIIGGGTPKTTVESYWNGNILWYSVVDAPSLSDTYVIDTNKKITQLGLENSSAKIVEENITIISARGTVGKIALTGQPMTFNQSCYALQHKVGNYYGYFSTQKLVEALQQRAHGSVFDTITKDTFKSVITVVPDKNIIKNFEILVEPIMKQIKNNLLQTQTLTKLRDTLLPKLMSGEVRV